MSYSCLLSSVLLTRLKNFGSNEIEFCSVVTVRIRLYVTISRYFVALSLVSVLADLLSGEV